MLSVLPKNENTRLLSQFVQPVRYGWELALPRRLFQRPPVLSTCWLIKKSLLTSTGGFKAVSRSIVPESYFARSAAVTDGYGFIRSRAVFSRKSLAEQQATAVRTRYPQLHRRPELVALLSVSEIVGIILPLVLCIVAIMQHVWWAALLTGVAYILFSICWGITCFITYAQARMLATLLLPLAILWDVVLMHTSMLKYEFSEVIWKGRNVCIPVMHVISKLPPV